MKSEVGNKSKEAFHGHNNYVGNYMYVMRMARILVGIAIHIVMDTYAHKKAVFWLHTLKSRVMNSDPESYALFTSWYVNRSYAD